MTLHLKQELTLDEFESELIQFDRQIREKHHTRFYHTIKETRSYFWQNFHLTKKEFDKLFVKLHLKLRELRVHGSPTGSFPAKDYIEIPDRTRMAGHKIIGLWSIE